MIEGGRNAAGVDQNAIDCRITRLMQQFRTLLMLTSRKFIMRA
jgi:hypothetical protein